MPSPFLPRATDEPEFGELPDFHAEEGGEPTCEHVRVYSGERFVTAPPDWYWICEKCGMHGLCWSRQHPQPIDRSRFIVAWERLVGPWPAAKHWGT